MILPGALDYWSKTENCMELDQTWRDLGLTPELETVRRMFLDIPDFDRRRVMELGCGTGRIIDLLGISEAYIACDQSEAMIAIVSKRYEDDERVQVRQVTIENNWPSPVGTLLCIEVLQHQSDPAETLRFILETYEFKHFIFTLMVGDSQVYGCGNGDGSRSVRVEELVGIFETEPEIVKFQYPGGIETWVIRVSSEDLSAA